MCNCWVQLKGWLYSVVSWIDKAWTWRLRSVPCSARIVFCRLQLITHCFCRIEVSSSYNCFHSLVVYSKEHWSPFQLNNSFGQSLQWSQPFLVLIFLIKHFHLSFLTLCKREVGCFLGLKRMIFIWFIWLDWLKADSFFCT